MAKIANSVIDVILGEATHGTRAERFEDMLAIASAIQNRAVATGIPAKDIVASKQEFNAFGSKLPAGVEAHRALAEQAWNQVQTQGPVHNGMFYATPKAVDNLPQGLTPVATTAGHQFFSDPKGRSFNTAVGYAKPDLAAVTAGIPPASNPMPGIGTAGAFDFGGYGRLAPPTTVSVSDFSLPDVAPAPTGRPDVANVDFAPTPAPGMGALLGFDLGDKRPNAPDESIQGIIQEATTAVLGPGATATIYSGQENAGRQHGSNRHGTGFAADVRFTDAAGNPINAYTNPQAMIDIAQAASARGATGIGLGKGYMAGNMHIDRVDAALPGHLNPATQGPTWGALANANDALLAEARTEGIMPTPDSFRSTGIPTPTSRPDPATAAMAGLGTGRPEGPLGGFPAAPPSTGGLWDSIGDLPAPEMPTEAPGFSIDRQDRQMPGGPMSMPNLAPEISLPDFAPAPDIAPRGDPFAAGERVGALAGIPSLPSTAPTPFGPPAPPTSPVDTFANLPEFAPVPEAAQRSSGLLAPPVGPVPSLAPPVASVPGASINPMKGSEPGRHNKAGFGDFAKGAVKGGMAAGLPGALAGGVIGGLRGSRVENPGPGKTGPLGLGLLGTNRGGPLGLGILPGLASLFGGGSGGLGGLGGLFDFSGGGWASSPGYGGTFSSPGDGGGFSTRGDSGWDAPGYR